MPESTQGVLVAEDRPEIRDLVVQALSAVDDLRVEGSALGDVISAIEAFGPDALVFGSSLRSGAAAELLRDVRGVRPRLPVVLFSPSFAPGSPAVREALALGGCTRLPCAARRYSPDHLPDLVAKSLVPWIRNVVLGHALTAREEGSVPQVMPGYSLHLDTPTPEDVRFVRELVRKRTAIVLEPDRDFLVQVRLAPLARHRNFPSISALVSTLREEPEGVLHRDVVDAMLSSQSSFFRDPAIYTCLKEGVLPELLRLRADEQRLSIWVAACSTGQEAYSVAMFLRESYPVLRQWSIRIVGTDASPSALERARTARYDDLEVSRGIPIQMLGRSFERSEGAWVVRSKIREQVEFVQLSPLGEWPDMPVFDLVLMRDVLLYLEPGAQRSVLERTRAQLREGGILVLGRTDPPAQGEGFDPIDLGSFPGYRRIAA